MNGALARGLRGPFLPGLAAGIVVAILVVSAFALGRRSRSDSSPNRPLTARGVGSTSLPLRATPTTGSTSTTTTGPPTALATGRTTDATTGVELPFDPAIAFPTLPAPTTAIWVKAGGDGDGSEAHPFGSINEALRRAQPGDVVSVMAGEYDEEVRSVRSGTAAKPIRLISQGARLRGKDHNGRLVEFDHSYLTLEGFDLGGSDKLIWVQQATGVRLLGNTLSGAGGECIRIKYQSRLNEVARNRIRGCGEVNFNLAADHKNGEAVYIGTAPEQRKDKNPTADVDRSDENWVHDNDIDTRNECTDIKEGSSGNVVQRNTCTGQADPNSGGFDSRGNGNLFLSNRVTRVAGAGVRLGGDEDTDGADNVVVANTLIDTGGYGVKLENTKQKLVCGNTLGNNAKGPATRDNGAPIYDPAAPCR